MRYGILPDQPAAATIKVRMVRTLRAVVSGQTVTLDEGRDYDLPQELAEALFRGHDADPAEAHAQPGKASQEGAGAAAGPPDPGVPSAATYARPRANTARRKP